MHEVQSLGKQTFFPFLQKLNCSNLEDLCNVRNSRKVHLSGREVFLTGQWSRVLKNFLTFQIKWKYQKSFSHTLHMHNAREDYRLWWGGDWQRSEKLPALVGNKLGVSNLFLVWCLTQGLKKNLKIVEFSTKGEGVSEGPIFH